MPSSGLVGVARRAQALKRSGTKDTASPPEPMEAAVGPVGRGLTVSTPRVCRMTFWALCKGFWLLFYILLGFTQSAFNAVSPARTWMRLFGGEKTLSSTAATTNRCTADAGNDDGKKTREQEDNEGQPMPDVCRHSLPEAPLKEVHAAQDAPTR